jgi:hypothetical protein
VELLRPEGAGAQSSPARGREGHAATHGLSSASQEHGQVRQAGSSNEVMEGLALEAARIRSRELAALAVAATPERQASVAAMPTTGARQPAQATTAVALSSAPGGAPQEQLLPGEGERCGSQQRRGSWRLWPWWRL